MFLFSLLNGGSMYDYAITKGPEGVNLPYFNPFDNWGDSAMKHYVAEIEQNFDEVRFFF